MFSQDVFLIWLFLARERMYKLTRAMACVLLDVDTHHYSNFIIRLTFPVLYKTEDGENLPSHSVICNHFVAKLLTVRAYTILEWYKRHL